MKTVTEMRDIIAYKMKELGVMRAACKVDNRQPNEDEQKLATLIMNEVEELERQIDLELRTQEMQDRLNKPQKDPVKPDPNANKNVPLDRKADSFVSFGEQMAAVMRAGMPQGEVDPRLNNTRAATGLNETFPSDGGFLVQTDFSSQLLKQAFETGILASRCSRVTIGGNSNSLKINGIDETTRVDGSRWGGIKAYWVEEAGVKTATKPKFRQIQLNLHKLVGLCYTTDELMDDSSALEGIIRQGFAEEIGFRLDDAIVNGLGVGMPLGFLNAGCLVTADAETGQAATTLVYQNVINMWTRLFAASRKDAIWLINQDVEPQLYQMSLAVGTGGAPVYTPPGGASVSPYSTLFGRPVIPIEQCQTLGTEGDIFLVDLKNGYLLAEKGGIATDVSIHVRFIYDESVFRFVMRADGQPILSSAITPFKGNNTLSHFISLDSRT